MNPHFYKIFFHFFLLFLIISVCYSHTLDSSWHFDDIQNILSNQNIHISELSWSELKKSFYSPDTNKISRPVANFTFALNYLISGLDTTSYHVVNIIIHILTSCFAYLIFQQTMVLFSAGDENKKIGVSPEDFALLAAVLWSVHPIQTQAVTFIVQRMASLAALFYFGSFYCYLQFRVNKGLTRKLPFLLLTICFFFLSLGTKENSILLPLALAGYEVAFFRTTLLPAKRYERLLLILFAIILFSTFFSYFSDTIIGVLDTYDIRKFTLWERLLTQPIVLSRYLYIIFYPRADFLALETDLVASRGLFDPPITIIAIIFITILAIFSIANLKKYPLVSFAIYFYFCNQLIESTFIPLELYFEHRNYIPSLFVFMGISYFMIYIIHYFTKKQKLLIRNFIVVAFTLIMISEGSATFLRNDVWRDEETLHSDTIAKYPLNPRPYIAIAAKKIDLLEYDEALDYLRRAERLYKQYPERFQENWVSMIYYNAGVVFRAKNENQKAIDFFRKSIQLDHTDWQSHVNLGALYFSEGDYVKAEGYIYNAFVLHPDNNRPAHLYNMFGRMLYQNNKYDEAIDVFMKGLKVDNMKAIHYNLAAAYLVKGDLTKAKSEIIHMPYDQSKNEAVYHIYRAVLFEGYERDMSIKRISSILVENKEDYCVWISSILKNNLYDVIFPDVSGIESQLRLSYKNELSTMKSSIDETIQAVNHCELTLDAGPSK